MICPKCGYNNEPQNQFCSSCGSLLNGTPPAPTETINNNPSPVINNGTSVSAVSPVGNVSSMAPVTPADSMGGTNPMPSPTPMTSPNPNTIANPVAPSSPVSPTINTNMVETPSPITNPINSSENTNTSNTLANSISTPQPNPSVVANPVAPSSPTSPTTNTNVVGTSSPIASPMTSSGNTTVSNNPTNKKFPVKVVAIIGVAVVLVILGIILVPKLLPKKEDNKSNKPNTNEFVGSELILIEENNKYGYIDLEGNRVVEPKYDYADEFVGRYAVAEGSNGSHTADFLIDNKGQVKLEAQMITYVPEYDIIIADDILYNGDLKQISPENVEVDYDDYGYLTWHDKDFTQAGIMDSTGKITYTYKFNGSESFLYVSPNILYNESIEQYYCTVSIQSQKYAIVNCDTGKIVKDYSSEEIKNYGDNVFELQVDANNSTYLYIKDDAIAYQTKSKDERLTIYPPNYVRIEDQVNNPGVYTYYDLNSKKIVSEPEDLYHIPSWEEQAGLEIKRCDNRKYGLYDGDKELLACEWDNIKGFDFELYEYMKDQGKDLVLVKKDDKTSIVNLKTKDVEYTTDASYVYYSDEGPFVYYKKDNKTTVYSLLTGKSMEVDEDSYVGIYSSYIIVEKNNKQEYYNRDLKLIYTREEV